MKRLIILFITAFSFTQLNAQEAPNKEKGFIFGASAGIGVLSMTGDAVGVNDGGNISLPNLKFGYKLNPKMAITIYNPGIAYEESGKDRSVDGAIPSVQYWAKPQWWVSGGFGLGWDAPAIYEKGGESNFGSAIQLSSGYEFHKIGKVTLDIQGTLFATQVNTDTSERKAISFLTGIGVNF